MRSTLRSLTLQNIYSSVHCIHSTITLSSHLKNKKTWWHFALLVGLLVAWHFKLDCRNFCNVIDESFASHTIDSVIFFLPFMAFNGISTDLLCKAFLYLNFGGTIVERHLLPYQLVDGLVVRLFNYIFKANSTWFFVVVAPSNLIKPPRF